MSRQVDESKAVRGKGRKGSKPNGQRSQTYRPSEEDKMALKEGDMDTPDAFSLFAERLETGEFKVTLTRSSNDDCYVASIIRKGADWQKQPILSAFHTDLEKVFRTLAHGLNTVYSEWPNGDYQTHLFNDEW